MLSQFSSMCVEETRSGATAHHNFTNFPCLSLPVTFSLSLLLFFVCFSFFIRFHGFHSFLFNFMCRPDWLMRCQSHWWSFTSSWICFQFSTLIVRPSKEDRPHQYEQGPFHLPRVLIDQRSRIWANGFSLLQGRQPSSPHSDIDTSCSWAFGLSWDTFQPVIYQHPSGSQAFTFERELYWWFLSLSIHREDHWTFWPP